MYHLSNKVYLRTIFGYYTNIYYRVSYLKVYWLVSARALEVTMWHTVNYFYHYESEVQSNVHGIIFLKYWITGSAIEAYSLI